jgi:hypothetical protein
MKNLENLIKPIIIILVIFAFLSCERLGVARICNKANNNIQVIIKFDNDYINRERKDLETNELIRNYHKNDTNLHLIKYDIDKFTAEYEIYKDSCAEIDEVWGRIPQFEFF